MCLFQAVRQGHQVGRQCLMTTAASTPTAPTGEPSLHLSIPSRLAHSIPTAAPAQPTQLLWLPTAQLGHLSSVMQQQRTLVCIERHSHTFWRCLLLYPWATLMLQSLYDSACNWYCRKLPPSPILSPETVLLQRCRIDVFNDHLNCCDGSE